MAIKYARNTYNEYTRIERGWENVYYDAIETDGLLQYMKGHDRVTAIFGQFERAYDENGKGQLVRWTVYLGTENEKSRMSREEWADLHSSSTFEYSDDLRALKEGNVDYE